MRIVHVITGLNQGGAEAMLEKLVLTGRRISPQVEQAVVNLGPPGVVAERLQRSAIPVESLGLRLSFDGLRRLTRLPRLLTGREPTVVQTWLWHADLLGGLCARLRGNRRVVWNLRNSMPGLASTRLRSRLIALTCACLSRWIPAKIICNSSAALHAHTGFGYSATKCVVIPNGFDLRVFSRTEAGRERLRSRWSVGPEELLVGLVARVDPMKDHRNFILAAAQVAAAAPRARFVLVGEGVTRDAAIRTQLAASQLTERFVLEERRDDIQDIMSSLDAFCLSSKSEGFPNVLGEAMACATPAVTTDVGDARQLVGNDLLVAPPGDPAMLAACMLRVLQMDARARRALGLQQREVIAAHFDIDGIWRRYLELYASI